MAHAPARARSTPPGARAVRHQLRLLLFSRADCGSGKTRVALRMNLAYGVFRRDAENAIGVAMGDHILDLRRTAAGGLFDSLPPETRRACSSETLNDLMALTPLHWRGLRERL